MAETFLMGPFKRALFLQKQAFCLENDIWNYVRIKGALESSISQLQKIHDLTCYPCRKWIGLYAISARGYELKINQGLEYF